MTKPPLVIFLGTFVSAVFFLGAYGDDDGVMDARTDLPTDGGDASIPHGIRAIFASTAEPMDFGVVPFPG